MDLKPDKEPSAVDVMRLDILMQYYHTLGCGTAALQWTDPLGGGPLIQAHLVALLYGRILRLHKESRSELFARVGSLAIKNVRSKGAAGFEFAPWVLRPDLTAGPQTIWPWPIVMPGQLTAPKVYTAILKHGEPTPLAPSGRWIHLEMAMGLERILAPSSALIAITGFSNTADRGARYYLARLLWQMNLFWGTSHMVSFFNEDQAYAAAVSAIRSGTFRLP